MKVYLCFADEDKFVTKVNELVGGYQMEGLECVFSPQRKMAFFASPFQIKQLSTTKVIFVDITYTGNRDFPYLFNMVAFNEDTLQCEYISIFN